MIKTLYPKPSNSMMLVTYEHYDEFWDEWDYSYLELYNAPVRFIEDLTFDPEPITNQADPDFYDEDAVINQMTLY